jgi:hypothetical protein
MIGKSLLQLTNWINYRIKEKQFLMVVNRECTASDTAQSKPVGSSWEITSGPICSSRITRDMTGTLFHSSTKFNSEVKTVAVVELLKVSNSKYSIKEKNETSDFCYSMM